MLLCILLFKDGLQNPLDDKSRQEGICLHPVTSLAQCTCPTCFFPSSHAVSPWLLEQCTLLCAAMVQLLPLCSPGCFPTPPISMGQSPCYICRVGSFCKLKERIHFLAFFSFWRLSLFLRYGDTFYYLFLLCFHFHIAFFSQIYSYFPLTRMLLIMLGLLR